MVKLYNFILCIHYIQKYTFGHLVNYKIPTFRNMTCSEQHVLDQGMLYSTTLKPVTQRFRNAYIQSHAQFLVSELAGWSCPEKRKDLTMWQTCTLRYFNKLHRIVKENHLVDHFLETVFKKGIPSPKLRQPLKNGPSQKDMFIFQNSKHPPFSGCFCC